MQLSDDKGSMTSWFYSNSVKAYPDEPDFITFPNNQIEDVFHSSYPSQKSKNCTGYWINSL